MNDKVRATYDIDAVYVDALRDMATAEERPLVTVLKRALRDYAAANHTTVYEHIVHIVGEQP